MIHVAITCAHNSPAMGRFCPALEDNIPADDAARWYAAAFAEHAWTVDDDGNNWCPAHNPADRGAEAWITQGGYSPIGDSGWEARLPEAFAVVPGTSIAIEVRQCRPGITIEENA
jgi:hypothetical protein